MTRETSDSLRHGNAADADFDCAETLLTGALAFMTAHTQAEGEGQREAMARKVVIRLQTLERHVAFTDRFRQAVGELREAWMRKAGMEALTRDADAPGGAGVARMPGVAAASGAGTTAGTSAALPAEGDAAAWSRPRRERRELWHAAPEMLQ